MYVIVNLADATEEEKDRFTGDTLRRTLAQIRFAVGAPRATVEIHGQPGIGLSIHTAQMGLIEGSDATMRGEGTGKC